MSNAVRRDELPGSFEPMYLYRKPMFMVTVSTVLLLENGVVIVEGGEKINWRFPSTEVKAGRETIQFAAIRSVKEQTGISLTKELLMPVDFRSDPERSKEGNVIDIGLVCFPEAMSADILMDVTPKSGYKPRWMEVDFQDRILLDGSPSLYMDHDVLLKRAVDVVTMMRND